MNTPDTLNQINTYAIDAGSNISNLLQNLATKLGTTIEKLYPTFIAKQIIDGYCGLLIFPFLIIISLFLFRSGYNNVDWKNENVDWENETKMFKPIFFGFLSVILICAFCVKFSTYLGEVMNPEYYAIKEIIDLIQK